MRYKYVLFDLDGTVTRSEEGVMNSVRYAMEHLGMPMPEDVPNRLFMGPPLSFSFREYCRVPEEQIPEALRLYRQYYSEKGIFECELYEGIEELLRKLSGDGYVLLVASSKPEVYVKRILEKFSVAELFTFIGGAAMDDSRSQKEEVLEYTLQNAGVEDMSKAVMVGDRKYDILGAKHFGMDSIGVLYGYGSQEELQSAGATHLSATAENISKLLENK